MQYFLNRKLLIFIILIVCIVPALIGIFHPGLFENDDAVGMVIRFSAFFQTLRNGEFPTRFLMRLNNGYGYPVSDFLYPGFLYLGVLIHVLGFNFLNTIKIILGGSVLFSGIFCFLWLRKLFVTIGAFVGSLTYVFFPYHLWDVYKRGSVGEIFALAIVPFVFWQVERRNIYLASLGIGLLILAHNTLAILFLPVIVGYMVIRKVFTVQYQVISVISGLALSVFFWLPALYDKQFTIFDNTQISDYGQYFLPPEPLTLLGYIFIATVIISIYVISRRREKMLYYFFFVTLVTCFLALPFSNFLWHVLPFPKYIQFPFRFLSVVCLGVAFLLGSSIDFFTKTFQWITVGIFLVLIYFSSSFFLFPTIYQFHPDGFYSTNEDTTTVKNEYMPRWVQTFPTSEPKSKVDVLNGQATIRNLIEKGVKTTFQVNVETKSIIRINTIYFPGWKVFVNGAEQKISYGNTYGVMDIALETGNYIIQTKFTETPVRLVADYISLISFVILLIFWLKSAIFVNNNRKVNNSL